MQDKSELSDHELFELLEDRRLSTQENLAVRRVLATRGLIPPLRDETPEAE